MKKILFICPYPLKVAAGQRLKFEPHFTALKEYGYEVHVHSFMNLKLWNIVSKRGHTIQKIFWTFCGLLRRVFLALSLKKYDCVYIFMNVFPFGPPILEKIYISMSQKVIFDIEDDILTNESGSINWLASILKSTSKAKYLISNADHIIASSPDLAKKCNSISQKKNAIFIPPTLESSRFKPRSYENSISKKTVIGWTGTFSSREYLDSIMPKLESLSKIKDFKLLIIGNFYLTNQSIDLEVIQWNQADEIEQLHKIDIGLYPLPKNDWVSGKSGLKALQYMSIGVVPVCTAVGNVLNFIEHEKDGVLIYEDEWIERLSQLLDDIQKRELIGKNARKKFLQSFSQEEIFKKYISVIGD